MSISANDDVIAASKNSAVVSDAQANASRWPKGIPYIIGNEACERFCYYGMRAILFVYLTALYANFVPLDTLPKDAQDAINAEATARVHLFFAGVYAFPMLGALVADRLFGKYRTIMWFSLVYCAGNATLAFFGDTIPGVYAGLAFIALGAGGIKPCVSANVGDQFTERNKDLVDKVFQIFYFSVNFGSFFATLLIPFLYKTFGARVAFGVPGILMALATLIFWLGRNKFVKVPGKPGGKLGALDALSASALFSAFAVWLFFEEAPLPVKIGVCIASIAAWIVLFFWRQRIEQGTGFLSVVVYAITHQRDRTRDMKFFDVARAKFGNEAAEGPPAVWNVMKVFALVSVFWALFDQHASSWVRQANMMDLEVDFPIFGHVKLLASQTQAFNPMFVMLIIPGLNFVVYPLIEKTGLVLTPLRKMASGMFLASLAFVFVALLQHRIDGGGEKVSALWQVVPYMTMTAAEVLVSAVGLEFAYTQAPRSMKSTIMGFWLLTVTMGNVLVGIFAKSFEHLELVDFFWTFAGLMAVAAIGFTILAAFYRGRTFLQDSAS